MKAPGDPAGGQTFEKFDHNLNLFVQIFKIWSPGRAAGGKDTTNSRNYLTPHYRVSSPRWSGITFRDCPPSMAPASAFAYPTRVWAFIW